MGEKIQTEENSKANELKELAEVKDYDEDQIDNLHDDHIGVDTKTDNDSEMKVKPTESVIKRGIPKNTKPAPAVVAIKMVDLLSVPDDNIDNNEQNTAAADISSQEKMENEVDNVRSKEPLEKQKKDKKLKLEKELKQQEKLKKEEEAKAKKEQERLAKLQKKEAEKLEKLKREEETKAKK